MFCVHFPILVSFTQMLLFITWSLFRITKTQLIKIKNSKNTWKKFVNFTMMASLHTYVSSRFANGLIRGFSANSSKISLASKILNTIYFSLPLPVQFWVRKLLFEIKDFKQNLFIGRKSSVVGELLLLKLINNLSR